MLKKVQFDKTEALTENYSFYLDPIKGEVEYTFLIQNILKDVKDVLDTGYGCLSLEGVKDINRYIKISKDVSDRIVSFKEIFLTFILELDYCGEKDGYEYWSVPMSLTSSNLIQLTSYSNVVNFLFSTDEVVLKELGVDVGCLRYLKPCPLCEGLSEWVYNEDNDGMKMSEGYLLVKNDYEDGHKSIKVDYCPKCGRRL